MNISSVDFEELSSIEEFVKFWMKKVCKHIHLRGLIESGVFPFYGEITGLVWSDDRLCDLEEWFGYGNIDVYGLEVKRCLLMLVTEVLLKKFKHRSTSGFSVGSDGKYLGDVEEIIGPPNYLVETVPCGGQGWFSLNIRFVSTGKMKPRYACVGLQLLAYCDDGEKKTGIEFSL
ncbi:hypothetical protein KIH87_06225 [Paraneptunicella aestuarii]|uniref:hypothetical protein n=1 Tax=Paraneptunicella aestuarii TaxID=2831148 RepID=UPI001E6021C6|nr:hypothetical protein [Paraneptunicella aestuarii]UAA39946.1 hypothetical protein KIH87_06225 [Paraneptunicella aestuarii]